MKKMPCLFQRDFTDPRNPKPLRDVTPGCEWVLAGEGTATRKWDGTACAIIGGKLYARYDAKLGKAAPAGAIPCSEPDPVTGHHPHWVLADGPEHKWIRDALGSGDPADMPEGTYEAIGPKINGNHENASSRALMKHGEFEVYPDRTWDGLHSFLDKCRIEGIVFHHPDGRMCKIRRDDYGLAWPVEGKP